MLTPAAAWLYTEAWLRHAGIGRIVAASPIGRDETIVLEIDCAQKTITVIQAVGFCILEQSERNARAGWAIHGYAHECVQALPTATAGRAC